MLARLTSRLFIAVIALSTSYLCVSAPHAPVSAISDQSPTNSQSRKKSDLDGRYFGLFEYPAAGLSGVGTLVIRDDRFEITIESTTVAGRISTAPNRRTISVVLHFDQPPAGSTVSSISLTAEREGKNLWLFSAESEGTEFYFGTKPRKSGGRDPASVNTTANASGKPAKPRPTPVVSPPPPEATPGLGGPGAKAGIGKKPNIRASATGAMESPANAGASASGPPASVSNTPANTVGSAPPATASSTPPNAVASATPGTVSNTNESFSSKLRGPANVGFQVPETMRLGETKVIELAVSPTESGKSLVDGFTEVGKSGTAETIYSDRMEAKLVGTGFNIIAAAPDIQPVEPGQKTYWRWHIQPKAAGTQTLELTLNAIVDGKDRKLITALKREIKIKVTWGQRASSLLGAVKDIHWVWGALIFPIGGAIYAWWRKRGSKRPRKKRPKTKS